MKKKVFELNGPQAIAYLVNANKTFLVWARGTGKTRFLGLKSLDLVHKMPRAKGGFIGKDYVQIYERLLPEITLVWEEMGYIQGLHWVHGKPLVGWDTAYVPPLKWDNCISWYNGTVIQLLSLKVIGAGNGLSLQWGMGDEAKFWQKKALDEILKAIRGLADKFSHLPEYLSLTFATDKFTDDIANIQWVLDQKKLMDPKAVQVVLSLQLRINDLSAQMANAALADKEKIKREIDGIEAILIPIRKRLYFYSEASSEDNLHVLGDSYIENQRMLIDDENEFNVAIGNEDPTKSSLNFYPSFNDHHKYESLSDVDPKLPLIISLDYQASIIPIVTAQIGCLPAKKVATLNFVSCTYVLQPKGLTDAVNQWADEHEDHPTKVVYFCYDHTAIGRDPGRNPFFQIVKKILVKRGWIVRLVNIGKAPEHDIKYEKIKNMYQQSGDSNVLAIRHNSAKNRACIISMERANTIIVSGKTKKDKRHEDVHKYPKYPQMYSTHFSDAHDTLVWAVLELNLIKYRVSSQFSSSIR